LTEGGSGASVLGEAAMNYYFLTTPYQAANIESSEVCGHLLPVTYLI